MKARTKKYLVAIILMFIGAVGYFLFLKKSPEIIQQTTSPVSPINQTQVSELTTSTVSINQNKIYKGSGFTVEYPVTWVIKNKCVSKLGGTDCINLAPITAITYYKQKYGNDSLSLAGFSAHKTDQNSRDWLGTVIGTGGSGGFAEDKQVTINGYPAAFVRSVNPNAYVDYYYTVANKGNVVYFYFRSYSESHPYGQPVQIDDYSEYLLDFQSIVNSIKFN